MDSAPIGVRTVTLVWARLFLWAGARVVEVVHASVGAASCTFMWLMEAIDVSRDELPVPPPHSWRGATDSTLFGLTNTATPGAEGSWRPPASRFVDMRQRVMFAEDDLSGACARAALKSIAPSTVGLILQNNAQEGVLWIYDATPRTWRERAVQEGRGWLGDGCAVESCAHVTLD